MSKRVIVAGTLDTKGEEIAFLSDSLGAAGVSVEVVDASIIGKPFFEADVSRHVIAEFAGESIDALRNAGHRGHAVAAMQRGFAAWIRQRHAADPIGGIISIGGSAGTTIATAGMRELPVGVPKLMVSTMGSGDTRPYVGIRDICMMYSVADFSGLNRLTRAILGNAAAAMAGMVGASRLKTAAERNRPLAAATMFGNTTPCVNRVKQLVEKAGFELLIFHASGSGGLAMEQLVRDRFVAGVLDITTTEWADELVGGVLTAGPHRLEACGEMGLPQVISVGALDMVNFGAPNTVPPRFAGRKFHEHNPNVTLMRTTPEENRELGRILARKANGARGPVTIVLPLRGISAIDAPGNAFYDAHADRMLFEAIRSGIESTVKLVELDLHINDPQFAEALVREFLAITGVNRAEA
jgi:uncharacterized protein (UPF0261 family)